MSEKYDLFIIDDSPTVLKKMLSILSQYNIRIKTFSDPIEGIKELSLNPPKVLFLDYNMPNMDGEKFIIKMSERYLFQHCSVYLITSMDFDEMATISLRTLGFSQIISKPFTEEDLVKALTDVIGEIEKKKIAS